LLLAGPHFVSILPVMSFCLTISTRVR